MMIRLAIVLFSATLVAMPAPASARQTAPSSPPVTAPSPGTHLRVFLGCSDCYEEYLRTEIQWVDFVRQPEDADVHLLASDRETGAGGREYVLRFVGLGRFRGTDQELRAIVLPGEQEDARRRAVLRAATVGFLGYIARDGLPTTLPMAIGGANRAESRQGTTRDPWNFWVFSLNGDASVDAEESNRTTQWEAGVTADRITDEWVLSLGVSAENETERFNLDEDEPLSVRRSQREFEWFGAKALGDHWSLGVDGELASSTFNNIKLEFNLAPAIEYNFFPYSQYASRQLRVAYELGIAHARYEEVTLFDKLRETNPRHQLSATLEQRQPWGTVETSVAFAQFLHDRSRYRLELEGDLSFRIVRGLSVTLEAGVSRVRDQLSLRRRGATQEEVLLRLRELQSGYEVSVAAGFRYTFGSIFNNIVNPRFGGRNGGGGGGGGGRN